MKFRTACPDQQAGESDIKRLSQGHNRMARVNFKPRPCRSRLCRFNHSTTLPRVVRLFNICIINSVEQKFKSFFIIEKCCF